MTTTRRKLELLSPAKNLEFGIEAINHGADAVYIGGPSFGARAAAGNAVADIEKLAAYAHRYSARVLVALNTILRDEELDEAQRLVQQIYQAGADALIVQDMGVLELDLPPLALHASTQTDNRTPEKVRFLEQVGFSQIVLARELSLKQISAIAAGTSATLEFFVHGALCVSYSGQCYISHAHTGRSANRGDCSQACRLPYQVTDAQGRFVAHDKHVLSMKDNNQSENLAALVDAGIRSFKIEGRYKDLAYVKNITGHYRRLFDFLLEQRPALARASSGRTTFTFTPDPNQNFNRDFTDYFVQGRQQDIGAFDTPKNPGQAIGYVTKVGPNFVELSTTVPGTVLHNGDGLCYYNLHKELVGLAINRAELLPRPLGEGLGEGKQWRVYPKDPMESFKDLRRGAEVNRNRDMNWVRMLEKKSSNRRIGVWVKLEETSTGFALDLTDEDGHSARTEALAPKEPAKNAPQAEASLREHLAKFGATIFEPIDVTLNLSSSWFIPASILNPLRRDAVRALETARAAAYTRPPRAAPVQPPASYPEDTLTYLANVFNDKARNFYARHGVKVIAAAYESHEEEGEVSLMITKHCVRFSLSLCPKQAKGITGVQGTIRAEPLTLINGGERLTLRFDCKPCEMHVVGRIRKSVLGQAEREAEAMPLKFYRTRPESSIPG
jgi:collagenase-like PrtC family protease